MPAATGVPESSEVIAGSDAGWDSSAQVVPTAFDTTETLRTDGSDTLVGTKTELSPTRMDHHRVQVKHTFIELVPEADSNSPKTFSQLQYRHRRVTSEPFGPRQHLIATRGANRYHRPPLAAQRRPSAYPVASLATPPNICSALIVQSRVPVLSQLPLGRGQAVMA